MSKPGNKKHTRAICIALCSVLFLASAAPALAVSTISTDISTGGDLTVSGNSVLSGTLSIGSLTGIIQAINGAITASSTLSPVFGGTGISTLPTYGKLLVGNALGGYTLTSTSSLGITSGSTFDAHSPGAIGDVTASSSKFTSVTVAPTVFDLTSIPWVSAFEANRLTPVADGTAVSTFTDFSTNGRNATQSGAARPVYKIASNGINNQPVLRFSGSQYMQTVTGGQNLTGNWYMASVVKHSALTGVQTYLAFGEEATGKRREIIKNTASDHIDFNGYNADVVSSTLASNSTVYFVEITKSGRTVTVYVNGTQIAQGTPSLAAFTSDVITVGGNNAGGEGFVGDMALGLFLNSVPTSLTLANIRGYVQTTYGITVAGSSVTPSNSNIILKGGTNGTLVPSDITDDGTTLTANRRLYVTASGNNMEHILKNQYSGSGYGGNVLKLQQLDPAGYSVVYGVGYDVADGVEGYGWAGGWGNVNSGGAYASAAFNEVYNANSTSYYPFRIIQTNSGGGGRRLDIAATGDITFFKQGANYPSEVAQMMIQSSTGYVGIGTTTPIVPLQITTGSTNATTSIEIGKTGQTKGSCLVMYDSVGTVKYVSIQNGAFVISSTTCK